MTLQPVTIRVTGRAPLSALLEHQDDRWLRLVLTTTSERPFAADRAIVEYTTARGIHRIAGTLRTVVGSEEILELARDGSPEVIQRRRYVRVEAVVGVVVTIVDPETNRVRTSTLDLSGGGMRIIDPVDFPLGRELQIEIALEPGAPAIHARVRVVQAPRPDQKGVELVSIGDRDRERLIRFVTERERAALRVARPR